MNVGISAIMITRNRKELLNEGLDRLVRGRSQGLIDEIVLVDDGSTDGTPDWVKSRFPEVKLIRLSQNLGIPQARNVGARHASGNMLLFLDDDGFLDLEHLPEIARHLRADPKLAAVGFPVIEAGPGHQGAAREPPQQMHFNPSYTFYGGAVLFRRACFMEAGGYDGDLFYSHEEDDLSLRLFAKGYLVAFCSALGFTHHRATGGSRRSRMRKIFFYYRNRPQVIWRHFPWEAALRETAATLMGGALRTLFTWYFPAFLAGSFVALLRLWRVMRRERAPLTRAQYEAYRQLGPGRMRLRPRLKALAADLRGKKRLDWI